MSRLRLSLGQRFALLQEASKLSFLVGNPTGGAIFVGSAGEGCSLLHEFPEVVPDDGNAFVDLNQICGVGHESSFFRTRSEFKAPWTLWAPEPWRALKMSNQLTSQ